MPQDILEKYASLNILSPELTVVVAANLAGDEQTMEGSQSYWTALKESNMLAVA
jgi:hypothetical protein